ncbi:beta-galactosidase GalB [Mucilaginibacter sp. X5P1]|uniref:beta-galactosidase GalB n=1 Tax=Mucilaginibacter sp. X5P1 TaxID=2723088 RepID=UPI0016205FA4|nr:beta-galactosidase GalB [Mucilaginibacter sp. X5P1]MBB6141944.1 beta-galactosidase [Mucilaginibacter sp. X5P1]
MKTKLLLLCFTCMLIRPASAQQISGAVQSFNQNWLFNLGDVGDGQNTGLDDTKWRKLNLPHDWSIEGEFNKDNPAKPDGGALPGGIGWYRKKFALPLADKGKLIFVAFDGVYQKSTVWVNGHYIGFRPNGYISFQYNITPFLNYGTKPNIIAVKVDNASQPNSRWYSGSGIYRNVWLITKNKVAVDHWGTFVTTPIVNAQTARVNLKTSIKNYSGTLQHISIISSIINADGKITATNTLANVAIHDSLTTLSQDFNIAGPVLWSVDRPYLYKVVTKVISAGKTIDIVETPLGIRYFDFDADKGFSLNGKHLKILGVCDHHDLGALGAAFNTRALERKLEILKAMGCNAIRTSHNPPAPELLTLTDKMGFIVMDEAFDCWQKGKEEYDYHLFFDQWHKRDLEDQVLRDRNHPSVIMWSIGNEIPQQSDTSGFRLAKELAAIVRNLDLTRPITAANSSPDTRNQIIKSGAIDLIGYNYHNNDLPKFHDRYPGKKFMGTETTSALETRGIYDMPSDSIRKWPVSKNSTGKMNDDFTVSAYDNVTARWGSTHEEAWKTIKKYDFLSGMFIWTGFDYIGEPTPYSWPARSSYFGIIDLAGFPKDVYYMYQSEWTKTPVLHLLPHWNWQPGKVVDVWAYYNQADEVELFLNGKSLGIKKKIGDDLHVMWRVTFEPGTLKAVSRLNGKVVLTSEVKTAGEPAKIEVKADRSKIKADGVDLSFITVNILDKDGNLVPNADNKVSFKVNGNAFIAGVDNGDPTSHDPFKASYRKAFNGKALVILQSNYSTGNVNLTATADGLQPAIVKIELVK